MLPGGLREWVLFEDKHHSDTIMDAGEASGWTKTGVSTPGPAVRTREASPQAGTGQLADKHSRLEVSVEGLCDQSRLAMQHQELLPPSQWRARQSHKRRGA